MIPKYCNFLFKAKSTGQQQVLNNNKLVDVKSMSQTSHTLIMMSQSNNPSSRNLKTANQNFMTSETVHQNTMTSQMHLNNKITPAKRHSSNVSTDNPTYVTKNHKLSHNPNMTLQNRSNETVNKAATHCISPLDFIPNMRLDFAVIKFKLHV